VFWTSHQSADFDADFGTFCASVSTIVSCRSIEWERNSMDLLLIIVLIVAVLAIASWGYGYYAYRPVVVDAAAPSTGSSPLVTLIGVIGLIALIAFVVLWATGWRFGFEAVPPG
jgi:hypothetical protein